MEHIPHEQPGEAGERSLVDRVVEEAVQRSTSGGTDSVVIEGWMEAVRPVVVELLAALHASATMPAELELAAAVEHGKAVAKRPGSASVAAREIQLLARSLARTLEERGAADLESNRRLQEIAEVAVLRALDGFGLALVERRDGWLSFYSHEMRNRLNALVNAIWLLKNSDQGPAGVQRICEIAERAARRLEELVKEFRELETRFGNEPPSRAGRKAG